MEKNLLVKVHKAPEGQTIVAVCDKDLFGKRFEEGNIQLDLTSRFYHGQEMDKAQAEERMRSADILNCAGESAVTLAKKVSGIKDIIRIKGVPFVQAVIV